MSKADNMLSILLLLKSRKRMTAKELAEALEINIRTVYRYIDSLCSSGVPIVADSGHNGGYSLLEEFNEMPLIFDLNEQKALMHAALFAQEAGYPFSHELNRAIAKLKRVRNQEQQDKISRHLHGFDVISPLSPPVLATTLQEIEVSVAECKTLLIHYKKGNESSAQIRHIDPYGLVYWKGKWYVVAYCQLRKDVRSFRVDRVESISKTEKIFERPQDFSVRHFFLHKLLPNLDQKEYLISVHIVGKQEALNDLCEHWLFGHALIERSVDRAQFVLDEKVIQTYVPYFLLPYGRSIQVVEPLILKNRLVVITSELLDFYQKDDFTDH
ncbi:YafY family protein [Bacillus sp. 03113]|uniref:helix-turn-helix transcriptional regulator n=1 Tax=Bacillus sp. 03113 TaxID=2578211 RepID=UPI0011420108|nr:YafY family protein [Bacillus sp. 03113]